MSVNKEHKEFHTLDLSTGWETPAGYPKGIAQKILSGALDEAGKRGTRTRLLRFAPGELTTAPFVHDYWEEVFSDLGRPHGRQRRAGQGRRAVPAQHLCVPAARRLSRSVQVRAGCMLLEIHYYDPV